MITSTTNQQIKDLVKLQKNGRYRKKKGCFVAEGKKLVLEAFSQGKLNRVFLSESYAKEHLDLKTKLEGIPQELVADGVFAQTADTVTPQGVLGIVEMPAYTLEQILSRKKTPFLLLDQLRDPGNLGTILRTAEGAGIGGVILDRESVDVFNPKAVRGTMGAIFRVPFVYVENLAKIIQNMKEQNIDVYGTWMEGSQIYDTVDYTIACGIVIGNEANGISKEVMEVLSGRIRIPMEGELESLNAAVSAAVIMYEAARQRRRDAQALSNSFVRKHGE